MHRGAGGAEPRHRGSTDLPEHQHQRQPNRAAVQTRRGHTTANAFPFRAQNLNPTYVNYADCAANINLQFTILISGLPCSDTIQVWAGTTDCTQTAARQADSGQTHCWPVTQQGAFAMAATSTGNIRAQDAVHYITNAEPPALYTPGDSTACQSQASPGGISDLSLYFMAIEADGLTVDGTSGVYPMGADLVGPYAPTNVTAGIGREHHRRQLDSCDRLHDPRLQHLLSEPGRRAPRWRRRCRRPSSRVP